MRLSLPKRSRQRLAPTDATAGPRLDLRGERGMTLIELLVAMIAGLIVTGALFAILDFSLRQDTRISDRVQANRIGRTAMNRVLEQLHSACTGVSTAPFQSIPTSSTVSSPLAAPNASNLWFVSSYGNSTSGAATPGVAEHDINWTLTRTTGSVQLGTLTDYSFPSTNTEPPWKFTTALSTANATARVLAKNVIPLETSTIFHYYKYETESTNAASNGVLVGVTAFPLSEENAQNIAQVTIAFNQAPESADIRAGHTASFSGKSLLRLSPIESTTEGTPCA